MSKGFDNVAKFYDLMATIVFGKQLRNAQLHFISEIPPYSTIFIIGGGTGWLLNAILRNLEVKEIIYIDASQKMLELTYEKNHQEAQFSKVKLIHGTEKNIKDYTEIDFLITPFILDVFTPKDLPYVVRDLSSILSNTGTWLLVDFDAQHTKQGLAKLLVQIMYWVFTVTCSIPAKKLEDFEKHIVSNHWQREKIKYFYFDMVKAVKFIKKRATPKE